MTGQVCHPVLWEKSVRNMIADGVDTFIEVGAGNVLCGLIKKIDAGVTVLPVEDADGLAAAAEHCAKERRNA